MPKCCSQSHAKVASAHVQIREHGHAHDNAKRRKACSYCKERPRENGYYCWHCLGEMEKRRARSTLRDPLPVKPRKKQHAGTAKSRASLLLSGAKRRSKDRSLLCTLTKSWVRAKVEAGCCELTRVAFDFSSPAGTRVNPYAPSIDRIDPKLGYTPDNCRVVCTWVNIAMNEHGAETFRTFALSFLKQTDPGLFVLPRKSRVKNFLPAQYELLLG